MRVGFFSDAFFPVIDGVVRVADAYASRLVGKCDVTFFTPRTYGFKPGFDDSYPYEVVRSISIMRRQDPYPQGFPQFDPRFIRRVKEANLDLLHVHSAYPVGLFAKSFARRHGIPIVGTLHSDFRPDVYEVVGKLIGKPVVKLMMSVYNSCDECWTASRAVGEMFCRDYGLTAPWRVMPLSTDHTPVAGRDAARSEINALYGLSDEDFVLSHVGRQDLQKREDFILRTLALLKEMPVNFKMLFIGTGIKHEFLKEMSARLGLSDRVIFCGAISDPALLMKHYVRTDLLLFASVSDTFGLVKIEASCQGTPTLCTRGAMAADGISDNVNGFTEEDSEAAFAARIEELYRNREQLRRVGEGAFRDLYRTWDAIVDDVYANYQRIIENHNRTNK